MDIENIIILGVVIVLAVIIIRFVTKILAKIVAFLIMTAVILYALFYWDGGIIALGNEDFMLYELEKKYCEEKKDTVKCECLVRPLIDDIESRYSAEEIQKFRKNKIKSINIITGSFTENYESIRQCFKENKSEDSFRENLKEFFKEFRNRKAREKMEEMLEEDSTAEL